MKVNKELIFDIDASKYNLAKGQGQVFKNLKQDEYKTGLIIGDKEEIKLILKYIKMLTNSVSLNWLIIANRDECVANFWKDKHTGKRDKEVVEVPWFEIRGRSGDR